MNSIIYACDALDLFQIVKAKNVPIIGDYVLLPLKDGLTVAKFKVVARFINHTGRNANGMESDMYCLSVEMA